VNNNFWGLSKKVNNYFNIYIFWRIEMTIYQGRVSGYSHDGAGVIAGDDLVIFVPGALKGELVAYSLPTEADKLKESRKSKKRQTAFGFLEEILEPAVQRAEPKCPYYGSCGGCSLQHASYDHQLEIKKEIVERAFRGLGSEISEKIEVLPVLGDNNPWQYRNKGIFALQRQKGRVKIGFYEKKSRQVAGEGCPGLFSLPVNGLIQALTFWFNSHDVKIGADGLHHIMIRESKSTDQLVLVLIGSGNKPEWLPEFLATFVPVEPKDLPPCARPPKKILIGIGWLSAEFKDGPVIQGKPEILWGTLTLQEKLGDVSYNISPESFFQVNTKQAEVLYDHVLAFAGLTGREKVWDLYCGTGTISLYLARKAKEVIGVEVVAAAVEDGKANARLNGIENVNFMAGVAEKLMPELIKQGRPDVVVLDPPSKGCRPEVVEGILAVKPERIVYVSCDPATLVRDLKMLTATGEYEIKSVQPIDMFGQCANVETITRIQRADL